MLNYFIYRYIIIIVFILFFITFRFDVLFFLLLLFVCIFFGNHLLKGKRVGRPQNCDVWDAVGVGVDGGSGASVGPGADAAGDAGAGVDAGVGPGACASGNAGVGAGVFGDVIWGTFGSFLFVNIAADNQNEDEDKNETRGEDGDIRRQAKGLTLALT